MNDFWENLSELIEKFAITSLAGIGIGGLGYLGLKKISENQIIHPSPHWLLLYMKLCATFLIVLGLMLVLVAFFRASSELGASLSGTRKAIGIPILMLGLIMISQSGIFCVWLLTFLN